MSLQGIMGGLSTAMQGMRADYHLTLGQLIAGLQEAPPDMLVRFDFPCAAPKRAISYRGYYEDLAFQLTEDKRTAAAVLEEAVLARGHTFTGYKGGEYQMNERTPLWASDYGEASGLAIVGLEIAEDAIVLVTKNTEDE